jgi:UDP-glucose 4-epimerase
MKVLVTGGAGFIGSHLADTLIAAGHEVVALDDLSTGRRENLAHLHDEPRFSLIVGDVRDRALMLEVTDRTDAVIHLAARIGLKVIVQSPLDTIEVNARGTETVLDAAARRGLPTIIASTSEVYGLTTKIPSAEADPICFGSPTVGRWSYACAKAYDEFYALALHREKALPVVAVRLFNTVGPRQTGRYGMVIPRFIEQALRGDDLTVYGDGTQTRCFCSVSDVVIAFNRILERIDTLQGEVLNIGNPSEISISALATKVIALAHSSSELSCVPFSEVYPIGFEEIMRRVPDIAKARKLIDFDPSVSLDRILTDVIRSVELTGVN